MREDFFSTIDTIEQLMGFPLGDELGIEDRKNVQFVFKERAWFARNLFRSSYCRTENQSEIYACLAQTMQDWASLGSLPEEPRKGRATSADSGIELTFDEIVDVDNFPTQCPGPQCLFCLGDDQLPLSGRTYSFLRPDHLRRHIQDCHFRCLDSNAPLWCSHPSCLEVRDVVEVVGPGWDEDCWIISTAGRIGIIQCAAVQETGSNMSGYRYADGSIKRVSLTLCMETVPMDRGD
ncbi:hypothetical protein PAAG_12049 [Paracoccidioides lutzii Pb01]|uniref:Uncharacterized protein n=1 Tax=Paracoccidioides lutzii (strain ATCC MYA-826 / Pb01) TaxID=502779 RepID=A0A0A2V1B5_PARBA|nr:hypothetical protein PAAG_12049 [Paracoccidioides lutzii Pb01]KGQ01278.1 hypothetical protein PAAG_12049 [Paracoccidioides lutzii Pb01]